MTHSWSRAGRATNVGRVSRTSIDWLRSMATMLNHIRAKKPNVSRDQPQRFSQPDPGLKFASNGRYNAGVRALRHLGFLFTQMMDRPILGRVATDWEFESTVPIDQSPQGNLLANRVPEPVSVCLLRTQERRICSYLKGIVVVHRRRATD